MEFVLASDHLRNPYFDRIVQNAVEVELDQLSYCLKECKINSHGYQNPNLNLSQRLCLQDCSKMISVDITYELANRHQK